MSDGEMIEACGTHGRPIGIGCDSVRFPVAGRLYFQATCTAKELFQHEKDIRKYFCQHVTDTIYCFKFGSVTQLV
jgi:hypothetical protein